MGPSVLYRADNRPWSSFVAANNTGNPFLLIRALMHSPKGLKKYFQPSDGDCVAGVTEL